MANVRPRVAHAEQITLPSIARHGAARLPEVELNLKKAPDPSKAQVFRSEQWRHGDEKFSREGAVNELDSSLRWGPRKGL